MGWLFYDGLLSPHGFCLAWDWWSLALTIMGNVMIGTAYFLIPAQLAYMLIKTKNAPIRLTRNRYLQAGYAAFILLCGVTHWFDLATIWWPGYRVQGIWLCLTGIVSLGSAGLQQYVFRPLRHSDLAPLQRAP